MTSRKMEFLTKIKPILDKSDVKKDSEELAEELQDVIGKTKFSFDENSIKELVEVFNEELRKIGKNPIVFSDIKIDENVFKNIATRFAQAFNDGINIGFAKNKTFLKDLSALQDAYNRNKNNSGAKTGKKVRSGLKNHAVEAFSYKPSDTATKIGNNLRAITNEFNSAVNWEDQYVALLKYIKAYKALEEISNNPKSLDKWKSIGSYAIQDIIDAQPEIEHSLQNIFNVAYNKATIGLTEAGDIDLNVKLTPIKMIDVYDITDGKGNIEVEVVPVIKKARKNVSPNLFRGVHKPNTDPSQGTIEGRQINREILGANYWALPESQGFIARAYGEESGIDDARTIKAYANSLNELSINAIKDGTSLLFSDIDKIDLLQYLFPGVERFKNVADPEGYDLTQKFYNEMARQAGFDLLKILNVDEGGNEIANTAIPLQDRIVEYIGNIPNYLDIEKFTPEIERDIISRQKGSAERWYNDTINRLEDQYAEAQDTIKTGKYRDKKYIKSGDNLQNIIRDIPTIIEQLKAMRESAMTAFDEAIQAYGGYNEEAVKQGLPKVISENEDGNLVGKITEDALNKRLKRYAELMSIPEDDENFDSTQEEIDDIYNQLISSIPKKLQNDADNMLVDFGYGDKSLNEAMNFFAPYLSYQDNIKLPQEQDLVKSTDRVAESNRKAAEEAERKAKADREAAETARLAAEEAERERLAKEAAAKAAEEKSSSYTLGGILDNPMFANMFSKINKGNTSSGIAQENEFLTEQSGILTNIQKLTSYIDEKYLSAGKHLYNFLDDLQSKSITLDSELKNILSTLGLINDKGDFTFNIKRNGEPGGGTTHSGALISDNFVIIERDDYQKVKNSSLPTSTQEAYKNGMNVAQVYGYLPSKYTNSFFDVQSTAKGHNLFKSGVLSQDVVNATEQQLQQLVNAFIMAREHGFDIENGGSNIVFDKDKGFSFYDLEEWTDEETATWNALPEAKKRMRALNEALSIFGQLDGKNLNRDYTNWAQDPNRLSFVEKFKKAIGQDSSFEELPYKDIFGLVFDEYYDENNNLKVKQNTQTHQENTEAIKDETKAQEELNEKQEKSIKFYDLYAAAKWPSTHENVLENALKNNPNLIADLTAERDALQTKLQPVDDMVSKISKNASIKNIPFEQLKQEAAMVGKQLSTMFDEGIVDTEEYVTLQYKLLNIFEELGKSYGSVKGSGAKDKSQFRQWIGKSIERETGFNPMRSGAVDALWGQGTFSIMKTNNQPFKMREMAGKLQEKELVELDSQKISELNIVISALSQISQAADVSRQSIDDLNDSLKDTANAGQGINSGAGTGDASSADVDAANAEAEKQRIEKERIEAEKIALQQENEAKLKAEADANAKLQADLTAANQQLIDAQEAKVLADANTRKAEDESRVKDSIIQGLREQLANVKSGEGVAKASIDVEELKNVLVAIDEASLETTLNKVFANILNTQTRQNDGENNQSPWALESTLQTVKGTLDNIQTNTAKIGTGGVQQSTVTDVGNVLATENTLLAIKNAVEAINGKVVKGTINNSNGEQKRESGNSQKSKNGLIPYELNQGDNSNELLQQKIITANNSLIKYKTTLQSIGLLRGEIEAGINALSLEMKDLFDNPNYNRLNIWNQHFQQIQKVVGSVQILSQKYKELGKWQAELNAAEDGTNVAKDAQDNIDRLNAEIAAEKEKCDVFDEELQQIYKLAKEEKERAIVSKQAKQDDKKSLNQQVKESRDAARLSRAGSVLNSGRNALDTLTNIDDDSISLQNIKEVNDLYDAINRLTEIRNKVNQPGYIIEEDEAQRLRDATAEVNLYSKQVQELYKNYEKFSGDNTQVIGNFIEGTDFKTQATQMVMAATNGRAQIKGFNEAAKEITYTLKTGKNEFTEYTAGVRDLDHKFVSLQGATKKTEGFLDSIKRKTKEIFTYFSGSSVIYKVFNELRQGIQYVKEIDSALTELKKVTDETEESYDKFLKTAAKTADNVGSTIKEVVSSTADWARLGYSLEDAANLAESTSVLLNVSEFQSIDDATSALVSTMQAFGYAAKDSMHVVDVMNEIGKFIACR